jgi:ribosomal-protein-alanine N-acetyltransferase
MVEFTGISDTSPRLSVLLVRSEAFHWTEKEFPMTIEAAFTHFPSLTTDRLHLRKIQPADAEAFFAIKSDPEVTKLYGVEPHRSLDDTQGWIRRVMDSYEQRDGLFWCLTLKGGESPIGGVVFWNFSSDYKSAEIGYELHRAYWRQGLMSEAISPVLTYGFSELDLHRIEANPLAINAASWSLLLKLGFTFEGNLRQRVFFRDQYMDQLFFGLLNGEWHKAV